MFNDKTNIYVASLSCDGGEEETMTLTMTTKLVVAWEMSCHLLGRKAEACACDVYMVVYFR